MSTKARGGYLRLKACPAPAWKQRSVHINAPKSVIALSNQIDVDRITLIFTARQYNSMQYHSATLHQRFQFRKSLQPFIGVAVDKKDRYRIFRFNLIQYSTIPRRDSPNGLTYGRNAHPPGMARADVRPAPGWIRAKRTRFVTRFSGARFNTSK